MTYDLYIGERSYSSWSLRGWLLFEAFGLTARLHHVTFAGDTSVADQLAPLGTPRTVPTVVMPEGTAVSESLAIAEELASRHPDAGIWPEDPAARATARSLCAEMAADFHALRGECPMNLRAAYSGFEVSDAVRADLDRIETLWAAARSVTGAKGPWLCGAYSAADAFFAPVAGRIAGYGLPVGADAAAYVAAHLADPAFRRWRAMGLARGPNLPWYDRDLPRKDWPGPAPIPAKAVEDGTPENTACPYSGKPVTHQMRIGDRVFGFCNAFCRDKTMADPEAFPAFMEIYQS